MESKLYFLASPSTILPGCIYGQSYTVAMPRAKWSGRSEFVTVRCPVDDKNHRRAQGRRGQLDVVIPSWPTSDLSWTVYSECLLSRRALDLFRDANLSGFEAPPVGIVDIEHGGVSGTPELWELKVTGSCGPEIQRPGRWYEKPCKGCGSRTRHSAVDGVFIDRKNWDGSDFSRCSDYPHSLAVISERAKDVIVGHRLKYCVIYPVEELPMDGSKSMYAISHPSEKTIHEIG